MRLMLRKEASIRKDHLIRQLLTWKPANAMVKLRFLFFPQRVLLHPAGRVSKTLQFIATTTYSTICPTQVEKASGVVDHPKNSGEVLARLGCSESDISKIFVRRPSLRWTNVVHLHSRLSILNNLGVSSPDLVKIISCSSRMLGCGRSEDFEERIKFLMTLFDSREMLVKAIVKNPSLLTYDLRNTIKPAIAAYEEVGVNRKDFILMLQFWRPTIIPRTSFDEEKLEYIRKTGVSKESKRYKYLVTLIGISRLDKIRQRVANLENLGLSNDEAFHLVRKFPFLLNLSVDKVRRNMTFVLGTLKLPANAVLKYPFLLHSNLETVLKPRVLLVKKMQDMGLNSEIKASPMTALKMAEKKFLKAFVECHLEDVAAELLEFYKNAKGVKRLGESSKKHIRKGFPL